MHAVRRLIAAVTTVVAMVLGLFAVSLATAPAASASHYRANQLAWHQGSAPREAEFHFNGSWRCTFYFNAPCAAAVGDTFSGPAINTGDGHSFTPTMVVTSVDVANDVVNAEAHDSYTYASDGPFTAYAQDCCRLSSPQHINNPDGDIRFETVVDFSKTTASPVGLVAPIVDCPINALCQFTVPAVDPDHQGLRWRLSTYNEGLLQQPTGAAIDPATGTYRWDTTGAVLNTSGSGQTFYSTQVMIENVAGGRVVSQTAVDFFIRLSNNTTNQAPVFVAPTPADGTVINGTVGSPLSIPLAATDPDAADTVTIDMLGSVPGMTFTGTPGNPAGGSYAGTPTTAGDYPLTATAADQLGLGATPRGYTVHIEPANVPSAVTVAGVGYVRPPCTTYTVNVTKTDAGAVSGMARIRNRAGLYFRSTKIVSVSVSGTKATIVAKGTWGGKPGATATITIVDGTPDAFGAKVVRLGKTVVNAPVGSLIRGSNTIS